MEYPPKTQPDPATSSAGRANQSIVTAVLFLGVVGIFCVITR